MIWTARLLAAVTAMLALALVSATSAQSASPNQIHNDCADDGRLSRNYSNADLRRARDTIPADLDEYSDCRDVIAAAIKGGGGGGGGGAGGAGAGSSGAGGGGAGAAAPIPSVDPATAPPEDNAELEAITSDAGEDPPSIRIGGESIAPGANGLFDLATAEHQLPTPLAAALLALALLSLGAGFLLMKDRKVDLSRVPLLNQIDGLRGKRV